LTNALLQPLTKLIQITFLSCRQAASVIAATNGAAAASHNTNKSKVSTVAKDAATAAAAKANTEQEENKSKASKEAASDEGSDYTDDEDYAEEAATDSKSAASKGYGSRDASLHTSSSKKDDAEDYNDKEEDENDHENDYSEEEYDDYDDAANDDRQHSISNVKSGIGPTTSTAFERSPTATAANDKEFLKALAACGDHECLTEVHKMPRSTKLFNFPHFMIIGFQKSATTSLFKYLQQHPDLVHSVPKEPNYFSYRCNYNPPEECDPTLFNRYVDKILSRKKYEESNGTIGVFEGSTHYLRGGVNLVRGLREMMPWLKLIINIREPISRAASMLIHNKDSQKVGCLMRRELGTCLMWRSQINGTLEGPDNYLEAVRPWFEEWPADQIHVIQYEELTEDESEQTELVRVKKYLGIDEKEPKGVGLGLFNVRRFKIRPEGWKMPRADYEAALNRVKPDTEALVDLLDKYGKIKDKASWLDRWQQVWDDNLKSCNEAGECNILLS
jgi:Sulfotransferase domain